MQSLDQDMRRHPGWQVTNSRATGQICHISSVWFLFVCFVNVKKKNQISNDIQIFLKIHTPVWLRCLQLSTDYSPRSPTASHFTLPSWTRLGGRGYLLVAWINYHFIHLSYLPRPWRHLGLRIRLPTSKCHKVGCEPFEGQLWRITGCMGWLTNGWWPGSKYERCINRGGVVFSGRPQGSVLSTVLFNILIMTAKARSWKQADIENRRDKTISDRTRC